MSLRTWARSAPTVAMAAVLNSAAEAGHLLAGMVFHHQFIGSRKTRLVGATEQRSCARLGTKHSWLRAWLSAHTGLSAFGQVLIFLNLLGHRWGDMPSCPSSHHCPATPGPSPVRLIKPSLVRAHVCVCVTKHLDLGWGRPGLFFFWCVGPVS